VRARDAGGGREDHVGDVSIVLGDGRIRWIGVSGDQMMKVSCRGDVGDWWYDARRSTTELDVEIDHGWAAAGT
jgi:hypothetical protein